ncbi:Fructose-bisphosphate aldolase [Koleobacter methoxysyntrophicus]|uniref:Fructose-bisphosphate aldolase n=1 Tax=Koleobacter methoxysyntrophicus TaxID=2751313 RepID=A0A8A0RLV6_9FIRM|nr:class II fructose-1,6-bisphosphate aldolase [Koleobacter methoxysyntrophicus]QSQ08447.1 Fructose-bisphosphate aldolase [Koleobacter methoxysyntrophicus]
MPFVTVKEILQDARKGSYAVGAFNTNNMEIVQAIVEAAVEENSPVILQASQGALKYAGIEYITAMVKAAAEIAPIPIALHLDHGTSFEQIVKCIRYGFTSVMIDGSKYPLEENIRITKKVVEIAGAVGVSVEAELGKIGGTEDDISVSEKEAYMTDPQEAVRFVKETGVDSLAIAIGTAHGPYKGEPKLDFDRLEKISSLVDIPLVLHGASGVPEDSIRKAVERGICKINIDTDIRQAFARAVREFLEKNPKEYDPRKILGPAKEEMKKVIREKIRLFGSSGKGGK